MLFLLRHSSCIQPHAGEEPRPRRPAKALPRKKAAPERPGRPLLSVFVRRAQLPQPFRSPLLDVLDMLEQLTQDGAEGISILASESGGHQHQRLSEPTSRVEVVLDLNDELTGFRHGRPRLHSRFAKPFAVAPQSALKMGIAHTGMP